MNMKKPISEKELKEAVQKLKLDEDARTRILRECRHSRSSRHFSFRKWQLAAVLSLLLLMLYCSPAMADLRGSLQAWLDSVTDQEVQEIYDTVQQGQAEASSTSREMTWDELLRKDQLRVLYKKGEVYPEAEVILLQSGQEPEPGRVCYDPTAVVWYLPSQTLSDEDLLQIIDYEYKVDYSLQTVGEANGNLKPEQMITPVISEAQALETVSILIASAYGTDVDPNRLFIETNVDGTYAIKYTGLEIKGAYTANCNILVSNQTGRVEAFFFTDMDYTAACQPAGENADPGKWYDKAVSIVSDLTKDPNAASDTAFHPRFTGYLLFYGGDGQYTSAKKIFYLFEMENGDTYILSFLYDNGILQTLMYDDSYLEYTDDYHAKWETAASRKNMSYRFEEIKQ